METDSTPVSSSTQLPEAQKISPTASSGFSFYGTHMYKHQLQVYAQKRNLELPLYSVERAGPCHASCFKCKVTLEGKTYESEDYFPTVKKAENAAAKLALASIYAGGFEEDDPSIYKNLLQEFLQKEKEMSCLPIPRYTTIREGPSHMPVFISIVEIQAETFKGQEAKTKKQAEMYAAKVAYIALRERKCKKDDSLNAQGVDLKKAIQLPSANIPEGGSDAAQRMLDEQFEFNQGKKAIPNSSMGIQVLKPTLTADEVIFWANNPSFKPVYGVEKEKETENEEEEEEEKDEQKQKKKRKKKIIVLPKRSTRSTSRLSCKVHRDYPVRYIDEEWIAFTRQ